VGGRSYGRLTADYDRLTKICDHAHKNVIFAGTIDYEEMPAYYSMTDVYFLPSIQENFLLQQLRQAPVSYP
jgi:1,2-diacylglycerol-3-alpha-glucose alpha-1,2-galactosyltransferase